MLRGRASAACRRPVWISVDLRRILESNLANAYYSALVARRSPAAMSRDLDRLVPEAEPPSEYRDTVRKTQAFAYYVSRQHVAADDDRWSPTAARDLAVTAADRLWAIWRYRRGCTAAWPASSTRPSFARDRQHLPGAGSSRWRWRWSAAPLRGGLDQLTGEGLEAVIDVVRDTSPDLVGDLAGELRLVVHLRMQHRPAASDRRARVAEVHGGPHQQGR